MTPADKLRELLASSPAMPNTEQLVRWWRTSKELLPGVLAQLDVAVNLDTRDADIIEARREARQLRDDLVHERAQLRREQDARADLRRELDALKLTAEERSGLEAFREQVDADMNAIGDNPIPSDAAMAAIRKVLGRKATTFEAGDVVRLRATDNGPPGLPMTIESVLACVPGKGIGVLCAWFVGSNLCRDVFHPALLEHTEAARG
jgi:uncharacterized protein YodC (DUF2158 family)